MSNMIILGAQWGDEGKGKLVDLLCGALRLHRALPGRPQRRPHHPDRRPQVRAAAGAERHPASRARSPSSATAWWSIRSRSWRKSTSLQPPGVDVAGQLRISNRAHVLLPTHRLMEKISEADPGRVAIGTTSRGIGPGYEDKAGRRGIRIADLLDREYFAGVRRAPDGRSAHARPRFRHRRRRRFERDRRPLYGSRGAHPAAGLRYCAAAGRRHGGREESAVRRRAGHHARSGPWHLSVRHFFQRVGGRRLHRDRRAAHEDRRRDRDFEGIYHARGRRAVSHRGAGRGGRSDPQTRQRIRRRSPDVRAAAAGSMCR